MGVPIRWDEIVVAEAPVPASQAPLRRSRRVRRSRLVGLTFGLIVLGCVGSLAVVGANSVWHSLRPSAELQLASPLHTGQQVTLQSASVERRLGFVTVTGTVTNRAITPLNQVEAVVEILDSRQQTVQVESGLLTFPTLQPGQDSSFRVVVPDHTQAVSYRVKFRRLLGSQLH